MFLDLFDLLVISDLVELFKTVCFIRVHLSRSVKFLCLVREIVHSLFQKMNCGVSSISWQSEYPKYTPLLAKILEGWLSEDNVEDKIHHYEEVTFNSNI